MAAPLKKQITRRELEFCKLIGQYDLTPVEAARRAFDWKAEPGSSEAQKARDLATRTPRLKLIIDQLRSNRKNQLEAAAKMDHTLKGDLKSINQFLMDKLKSIRDNESLNARVRYQAIQALEKLRDPSTDRNLIMKWIDVCWRYQEAHCPSCHETFPLAAVSNKMLDQYRANTKITAPPPEEDIFLRRMNLIGRAARGKTPHPGQVKALSALERHVVATSAARGGKSLLIAMFGLMAFMLPGVEIWILARVYEDAASEAEYLQGFLKTLFHPYEDDFMKVYEDKTNGELVMISRWGSTLKIRSAKSKGSITGRELEVALVAEPGWVPADIFNHLRARMVSRLGRIIALGTPQNSGGFLTRLMRATGRDEDKRIIRPSPEDRLIENGCPWDESMLIYTIKPEDNPAYPKSELRAARRELSDSEYSTEFEGKISSVEGAKFPYLNETHLRPVSQSYFANAQFVLGIDQGTVNFAACLTAWDGKLVVPCFEYYDNTATTMKSNLLHLRKDVMRWITLLGGNVNNLKLTITDKDPQLWQIMEEMKSEGNAWPTQVTERYHNRPGFNDNWRKEVSEFFNNMTQYGRVAFHDSELMEAPESKCYPGSEALFSQMREVIDRVEGSARESGKENNTKGWIVRDAFRGDHVLDALMFTLWTIYSGQLDMPVAGAKYHSPYEESQMGLNYLITVSEEEELAGMDPDRSQLKPADVFQQMFGRQRKSPALIGAGHASHYPDA